MTEGVLDVELAIPPLIPIRGSERVSHLQMKREIRKVCNRQQSKEDELSPIEWTIHIKFSRGFTEEEIWKAFSSLLIGRHSSSCCCCCNCCSSSSIINCDNSPPNSNIGAKSFTSDSNGFVFPGHLEIFGISRSGKDFPLFFERFIENHGSETEAMKTGERNCSIDDPIPVDNSAFCSNPAVKETLEKRTNQHQYNPKGKKGSIKNPPSFVEIFFLVHLVTGCIESNDIERENDRKDELEEHDSGRNSQNWRNHCIQHPWFDAEIVDERDLSTLLKEVTSRSLALDKKAKVVTSEEISKAIEYAESLVEMIDFCDRELCIHLIWTCCTDSISNDRTSSNGIQGMALLDALLSLGLRYDWRELFRVTTSHFPHCLDVEMLSSPCSPRITELTFSCFLPYCPAPLEVTKAMLNCAKYARTRLGGMLIGEDGKKLNERDLRQEAVVVANRMKQCSVIPGGSYAFSLFL